MASGNMRVLITVSLYLLVANESLAHHVMAGETPLTALQGLLSGIAHPVIGIDHLAFLLLVGSAASLTPRPALTVVAFITSTITGCLLFLVAGTIPGLELAVSLTVVLVGAMLLTGRDYPAQLYLGLFALAGLLHGAAYGGAIIGSEVQPLLAYLIGFAGIQYLIAMGAWQLVNHLARKNGAPALYPRLAAALATGVGLALLLENIERSLVV